MRERITETARAKLNLALHVTGRRADGYHLLDSLVTFASHGDRLQFVPAAEDDFILEGRFAPELSTDADNLVLQARDSLRHALTQSGQPAPPVRITLSKDLPIASGIGGGSADAAATLRGLMRLWQVQLDDDHLAALALSLGADVPMCLVSRPAMARGIGEDLTPATALPALSIVMLNPLIGVSTPEIFRRLTRRDHPPVPALPQKGGDWITFLQDLRNDLEPAARAQVPQIGEFCDALTAHGAQLARMSGSGATCFGIFDDTHAAKRAATELAIVYPDAYIQPTETVAGDS
ncbi:4-(cytidine 5'-diphospho)-2-C-methyl-D-erythritol kinase [Rhizobium sp. FY34]|uniref:4-(cytidine 5'-diphospho)-2-C-methyl-D-erythritol kinase n=1 Tax=Rhizobium sp. FY34 TaxID=2562309 RepID=UPI0010BF7DEB|nr:4-(cytidine 5'-diphospho)-2-C-methyl-D-erythritol kinase [Rhizobium sp. FY34]